MHSLFYQSHRLYLPLSIGVLVMLSPFLADARYADKMGAETLREMFTTIYQRMQHNYPVEYVLKNNLLLWIRSQFPDSYIETEYWMLGTRADVNVITKDRSIVYEIKTRSDSHQRIKSQIKDYSEVFDEIILVTEEEYSFRYHKHVPSYIGLMSMTSKGHIQILMPPQKQTDRLKSHAMLHQMRKAEKVEFVKRLDPEKKFVQPTP